MQKSIITALLAIAIAALTPAAAVASDGAITVNGAVATQTCTINGGSPNFTVTLPKVSAASVTHNGGQHFAVGGRTSFNINLTGCAAGGGARAFFETGSGVAGGGFLHNTGTATGVQIQLLNAANNSIVPGSAVGTRNGGDYVPIVNGSATLTYSARYISGHTSVGPGTVTASVTYYIEYQ